MTEECGEKVEKLEWSCRTKFSSSDLLKILNFLPNLNHFAFHYQSDKKNVLFNVENETEGLKFGLGNCGENSRMENSLKNFEENLEKNSKENLKENPRKKSPIAEFLSTSNFHE